MAIPIDAPNPTPALPCSPSRARRLAGGLHCARCPGDGAVDFGSGVPRRDRGSARRLRGRGRLEAGGLPGDLQVPPIPQTFPSLLLGPPIYGGAGPHSHPSTLHPCPAIESAPVQLSLRFTAPGWGRCSPCSPCPGTSFSPTWSPCQARNAQTSEETPVRTVHLEGLQLDRHFHYF